MLRLVDSTTGNDVSGITITDNDNAATYTSACGGVTIPLVTDPDTMQTAAGTGIDCGEASPHSYALTLPNLVSSGPGTIPINRVDTQFLLDNFAGIFGTNLSAHSPDIGGAWTQELSVTDYLLNGSDGINMPGPGGTRYQNAATPTTIDYSASLSCHADAGWSDVTEIAIRWDEATLSGYVLKLTPPGTATLNKRVGGIDTVLDTASFIMPTLSNPVTRFDILAIADSLTVTQDFAPLLAATDATFAIAGLVAISGNRSVGQPVHITQVNGDSF